MGQGHYQAVIWGVVDDKIGEHHGYLEERIKQEHDDVSIEMGRIMSYESDVEYLGLPVAVSDAVLSEWWHCGLFEKPFRNIDVDVPKQFPKELERAKKFWNENILPVLKKRRLYFTPGLHPIKDYD